MEAGEADGHAARPVAAAEFAALMARFAPYEETPQLAVAVSGGADSLALALLADRWARAQGGGITALTVDHRLRHEAADEAAAVAAWLGRRGIAHTVLLRAGPLPRGAVQAAARFARYQLLEDWCAAHGVLHLLTAHHRDDQAETLLLRLARGSGLNGLAGMAALVEHGACRVLRPLLAIEPARLKATLGAEGQSWIDDPSNFDPAYARVRLRSAAAILGAAGLVPGRLAATARHLARARATLETGVAELMAASVVVDAAGFAMLDAARLVVAPRELALRALGAIVATVGGTSYPPRFAGLSRLHAALTATLRSGQTLGGCRILPRRNQILVCREPHAVAPPVAAPPGATVRWDGRFVLRLDRDAPAGLALGALGAGPEASEAAHAAGLTVPAAARPSLPALRDATGVWAVPHLDFRRRDVPPSALCHLELRFQPVRPLTHGCFTVV